MKVAFSGKFRSGKDTARSVIDTDFTKHLFFALRVKETVAVMTGTTLYRNCHDKNHVPEGWGGKTLGQLQQIIGEGMRREAHPDCWLNEVMKQVDHGPAVITDLRYENEAERLKAAGFVLVRINVRPDILEERRKGDPRDPNHPSETALDNYEGFHHIVTNDGTKQDFEDKIKAIFF